MDWVSSHTVRKLKGTRQAPIAVQTWKEQIVQDSAIFDDSQKFYIFPQSGPVVSFLR